MRRKFGFTVVEIIVVIVVIIGIASFAVPAIMDNTNQARLTSTWRELYAEIEYVFSIIEVQTQEDTKETAIALLKVPLHKQSQIKTAYLFSVLRPSLRLKNGVENTTYKPVFMNGAPIPLDSPYYFDNYFFNSNQKIVGISWDYNDCKTAQVCGKISFDINGLKPPNAWGKDIFGANIFDTKIEPFGKELGQDEAKRECFLKKTGLACSYYYLVGGRFD